MIRTSASALTLSALAVVFATPVSAQTADTGVPTAEAVPLIRPIDAIRARAQEIKQNALRPSATATPGPAPLRLEARPINVRIVETATSTPPGSAAAVIRMYIGSIRNRLENALSHLSRFLTRIESRLEKMEAAGKDTTAIAALLAEAEMSIARAQEGVAAIGTDVGNEDDRMTIRMAIGADVAAAQAYVRLAHDAVRQVVAALVAAAEDETPADPEAETIPEIE